MSRLLAVVVVLGSSQVENCHSAKDCDPEGATSIRPRRRDLGEEDSEHSQQ